MYERTRNQYIFKLSTGKTINIYLKDNVGLCMSVLNKRNMWTESTVLTKDCFSGFSADLDRSDKIHIFYQDKKGNLHKGLYENSGWSSKPILSSKNNLAYEKHLQILCSNDRNYMFYILEYSGNKLLSYQIQNANDIPTVPKVIDYSNYSNFPFTAFVGSDGQPKIIYTSADSRHNFLGIKTYNTTNDTFSEFIEVDELYESTEVLSAIESQSGSVNILWNIKNGDRFNLCYKNFNMRSKEKTSKKVIATASTPFNNSSMVLSGNAVISYWCHDANITSSYSFDGTNWSQPEKYAYFDSKPFYCITYKSNFNDRLSSLISTELPGNFTNGYRLGFTEGFTSKGISFPTNAPTATVVDQKIEERSLEVENLLKSLTQKLENIELSQKHFNIEMSKLSIKIELLDSELTKLKTNCNSKEFLRAGNKDNEEKNTYLELENDTYSKDGLSDGNFLHNKLHVKKNNSIEVPVKKHQTIEMSNKNNEPKFIVIEGTKKDLGHLEMQETKNESDHVVMKEAKNESDYVVMKEAKNESGFVVMKEAKNESDFVVMKEAKNESDFVVMKEANNERGPMEIIENKNDPKYKVITSEQRPDVSPNYKNYKTFSQYDNTRPIMPGTGFSKITADFLNHNGKHDISKKNE